MCTPAFRTALTLYDAGTLTLPQAARHAGVSPVRMQSALRANGRWVPDSMAVETTEPIGGETRASAD
jgi:hypothetical protein